MLFQVAGEQRRTQNIAALKERQDQSAPSPVSRKVADAARAMKRLSRQRRQSSGQASSSSPVQSRAPTRSTGATATLRSSLARHLRSSSGCVPQTLRPPHSTQRHCFQFPRHSLQAALAVAAAAALMSVAVLPVFVLVLRIDLDLTPAEV